MVINRYHFRETFAILPTWRCSSCDSGTLAIVPDTLKEREEPQSQEAKADEAWDPEWITGAFSALLDCQVCGRSTVVAGKWDVEDDFNQYNELEWSKVYQPQTFTRPPAIFPVSANLPIAVKDQLVYAFGHFWDDPDACGSAIRRCVEAMLTDAKVKRITITNGKRRDIALHNRIEHYTKGRLAQVKERLIAIKWVGNDTTHFSPEAKTRSELLDAFELLQSVLYAVYDDRSDELDKLAQAITRRKGKSPKPKKRRLF